MTADRRQYLYASLFCEENIWHLARELVSKGCDADTMTVLLLSNPGRKIVVLNQSCRREGEIVIWDYHVILQRKHERQQWIYDFDSRLDFPSAKESYFTASFPKPDSLHHQYQMFIRHIPAASYLRHFSSDRSHMKNVIAEDMFPPYPPIIADEAIALAEYWDMSRELDDGSRVEIYAGFEE